MNIGFVNNGFQLGGAETVVRQLVSGMQRKGHSARLYVADGKEYPRNSYVVPLYPRILSRFHHSRFSRASQVIFPRDRWTDHSFRGIARSYDEIIHIHNFHGRYASIGSLVALSERKPVVWTFHRFWGVTGGCDHPGECLRYRDACGSCPKAQEWPMNGLDDTAEQLALKKQQLSNARLRIVAPSKHLERVVRESSVGRNWHVTYIPNGVDPAAFGFCRKRCEDFRAKFGLRQGEVAVLMVNRNFADPLKGHGIIEEALRLVGEPNVRCILVGGNSSWAADRLPASIARTDCGYVADRAMMAELYEASDILLYASPGENFPCVTLEAMSSECCVVSTPTDGVLEQIVDGVNGRIAGTMDPQALAAALISVLRSPELRTKLGGEARNTIVRSFSEEHMVNEHEKLYEGVLDAWPARRDLSADRSERVA